MDIIFSVIRVDTFWKILLFIHFALAPESEFMRLGPERSTCSSRSTPTATP
jgi:hypothetical protein